MNIENIMMIVLLILGICFWGYVLFSAIKDDELKDDWKKNKDTYIGFIVIFLFFMLGDILWFEAEGEWRDVGIIIAVLSGVGFWVWGLKSKNEED